MFTFNYDNTGEAELEGFTLKAYTQPDEGHEPPWEAEDGHGPVREARGTTYASNMPAKGPSERPLVSERGWALYYDFAEACRIARAERWDAEPYNTDGRETPKQQAAKAAEADFKRLQAYCNGDWHYIGVIVDAYREGIKLGSASLWGIESDADGYLEEAAEELAAEAVEEAKATLAKLAA